MFIVTNSAAPAPLSRVFRIIAAAIAFVLAIGGVFITQSIVGPPAYAIGNQTTGTFPVTGWYPSSHAITEPLKVDNKTLYAGSLNYGWAYFATNGEPVAPGDLTTFGTNQNPGTATSNPPRVQTGNEWTDTIAVDADIKGVRGQKYGYSWDFNDGPSNLTQALNTVGVETAGTGITNTNSLPLFRIADGGTQAEFTAIPLPGYFGNLPQSGGTGYWSGGEVVQRTGEIMFSGRECSNLARTFDMMLFDPYTGHYSYSGRILPASPGDDIFGTALNPCPGNGYVASDMALDANGNAYLLVTSNAAVPSFGVKAGLKMWLVRVVPSESSPWTYELVTPLTGGPEQGNVPIGTDSDVVYGMSFYEGWLYALRGANQLVRINPMSGQVFNIPYGTSIMRVRPNSYDLASAQTVTVIEGTVYNDEAGDGSVAGDAGLPGQVLALYAKSGNDWVYQGKRNTNDKGNYAFLVSGNAEYIVRLVHPQIDGINAWQTYASAGGTLNPVVAHCASGDLTSGSGQCFGALAAPVVDPPLPTADTAPGSDTATTPDMIPMYSSVTINTEEEVASINFGVRVDGSFGDAAAGPAGADAPVHNNAGAKLIWLGSTLGSYPAPATDNTAHDATDDGVYIDSYAGKLPVTNNLLAGTRTYQLAADVSGPAADLGHVAGWTTGGGDNTWKTAPAWSPAISSGKATGPFQFQPSGVVPSLLAVQMRVSASTVAQSLPTNANGQYQAAADAYTPWTTPGEIEDYLFKVADAIYRPAAKTTGGQGTFTVDGTPVTTGNTVTVGAPKGTTADKAVSLTAQTPSDQWFIAKVLIRDTETGDLVAQPALTAGPAGAVSFSYTPVLGSDVIVEVTYTRLPDPVKSTLTLDKDTTVAGTPITAKATVVDDEGQPLAGTDVLFTKTSADVSLSAPGCTTDSTGVCTVEVTSVVAAAYPDEISATVDIGGVDTPITGSPKTVTFTVGAFSYSDSVFEVTPRAKPGDEQSWVTANGTDAYTGTLTARDDLGNLLPGLALSDIAFSASGADVEVSSVVDAGGGRYVVTFVSKVADPAPVASVQYQGTAVGTGLPIPFKVGAPVPGPVLCDDGREGTHLFVDGVSLVVGDTAHATALVTDELCNPVPGVTVSFSLDPGTSGLLGGIVSVTDADGKAYANITDAVAESVTLNAMLGTAAIHRSPQTIVFAAGGFSYSQSAFTVTPAANPADEKTWVTADGKSSYTGTLTAKDEQGNLLTGLALSDIAFAASSGNVAVSSVVNAGAGKYTVTFTSKVADGTPAASVAYKGAAVGTALPVPFAPGTPVGGPVVCDDGREGTRLSVDRTTLAVGDTARATALVTDELCNPVPGVTVSFSLGAGTSAVLGGVVAVTGADGKAYADITDTKAEAVVLNARLDAADIYKSPQTVTFVAGGFSYSNSAFVVSPAADPADPKTWVTADGVSAYTGTLTAKDEQGNVLPGLALSDIVFSASGGDVVVSDVVDAGAGKYTVTFTSKVADSTPSASVKYAGAAVGSAQPVPFRAGAPVTGPVACDDGREGTHLTVSSPSAGVGESVTATALVTDEFCNPVSGVTVSFASTLSSTVTPASGATGDDGLVSSQVRDGVAETVDVHASIVAGEIFRSPQAVAFTVGGFSYSNSMFEVSPGADPADGSKTNWVTADGVSSYTGTLTAKDEQGNALPGLALSDITFSVSSGDVVVGDVVNAGAGKYTVALTSKVADGLPAASVKYKGSAVGSALPVPFKAGGASVGPFECGPGQVGTNISVNPGSVTIPGNSVATAYVTDKFCNPVGPGVPVSFTVTGQGVLTPASVATNADSKAVVTVSDLVAESVGVTATLNGGLVVPGSVATVVFLEAGTAGSPDAPVITSPGTGSLSNSNPLVVSGTGGAGASVNVHDADGSVVCTAVVQANGSWTCAAPLADGKHVLTATQTDASDNVSPPSAPVTVIVDATAPDVPVIDVANKIQIGGSAEPGATVTVTYPKQDGSTGTVSAVVDKNGHWSVPTPSDAVDGTVTAVATDPAGNVSGPATHELDVKAPGKPVVDVANANEVSGSVPGPLDPGTTVTIAWPDGSVTDNVPVNPDGSWSVETPAGMRDGDLKVTATDPAGNVSDPWTGHLDTTAPAKPVVDVANATQVSGSVPGPLDPGTTVTITWPDGSVTDKVPVGSDGSWSVQTPAGMPEGDLMVTATDPAGNVSDPWTGHLDTTAPDVPVITVANKIQIGGSAEPGATVTVTYPKQDGSTGTVTTEVDKNGHWSVPTPSDAVDGTVTAVSTDPAGNVSGPATHELDVKAPGKPVVDVANANEVSGSVPGPLDPGTTVTIAWPDGSVTENVPVNPDGSWSIQTPAGMPDGDLKVTATDPAGNVSDPWTGQLDTTAPAKPVVDVANATQVSGSVPGPLDLGTTVTVTWPDGSVTENVPVNPDGSWSVQTPAGMRDGDLKVTATDPAGNVSDPWTGHLDTTVPDVPTFDVANKIQIGGSAEPGATVTVTYPNQDGSTGTVSAEVDKNGHWSVPTPSDAVDGTVTAVATDPAGNVSGPATHELDVTPPGKPVVDVANGREVTGSVPGPLDPGTTVTITWPDGSVTENVPVKPDSSWSVQTPAGMVDGDLTVTAADPAGNVSDPWTGQLVVTPPPPPVVNESNGSELTGSGVPGDLITITDKNGDPVPGCETLVVDENGRFGCTPDKPLRPETELTVTATDPAGNTSSPTMAVIKALGIDVAYPERHHLEIQAISGYRFNAHDEVCLVVYPEALTIGCKNADAKGEVTFMFEVAPDWATGDHPVTLIGKASGQVSTSFAVVSAAAVGTGGTVSGSPGSYAWLLAAWIMVGAGLGAMSVRRRTARRSAL